MNKKRRGALRGLCEAIPLSHLLVKGHIKETDRRPGITFIAPVTGKELDGASAIEVKEEHEGGRDWFKERVI
jgi:hypothetical protein